MSDDLVNVFEAATLMECQMVSDRLTEVGIETFIDNTDSPLDGLTAGDQMKIVRVLPGVVEKALEVVREFREEKPGDFESADDV